MNKYSAEYRVDDRRFNLTIFAKSWQEAEFHLDALKINGDFVEKDQIEYNLEGVYYCAQCRYFETEGEARKHLRHIKFNSFIDGEIVFSTRVPNFLVPERKN